jgi:beta-lactam-binding protein with PASTA domain
VPGVVGLTQSAAQVAISSAGLTVGEISGASSSSVPVGRVISQNPPAGSNVSPATDVALVISTGVANLTVPDVVGLTRVAAQDAIVAAGLTVGTVVETSSESVPAGRVISQDPGGGASVAPGSGVALTVSTGPGTVSVPDVVGLTQNAAENALVNAGLVVGPISTASSDVVPAGRVISQEPAGGASVAPGASVALVISSGLPPVTVPDVVDLTQAAAESAIEGAGLVVGAVQTAISESVPAGRVMSQNPGAGSSVDAGSSVALVVSIGPTAVTVPDVLGLSQAAAESAIGDAGLLVGPISTSSSNTVPEGHVISQDPGGGASVAPGASVALVISSGLPLVTVPEVVGMTQSAAENEIEGAGLVVGPVETASSDTVPAGRVISQEPDGGVRVASGASVALVVSTGPIPVTVPDVVGLTRAAAENAIEGAGLVVGPVSMTSSDTVPEDHVISQDPDGNGSAAPGASVSLVVSTGPATADRHLDFDGGNDVVTVPNSSSLRLANAVTVEAWIQPRTIANGSAQDRVVKKGSNYELHISTGDTGCAGGTSGHVQWRATIAGTNRRVCGGVLTPGQWHHVAGTYNGTDFSLYLDGIRVANIARSGSMALDTSPLLIGNIDAGTRGFDGAIDDVAVWSRALTATEIAARINQEPGGGASGLAAFWSFNESSGQPVLDSTTNANHGTLGLDSGVDGADPSRAQ